jgi:hypothetical protein
MSTTPTTPMVAASLSALILPSSSICGATFAKYQSPLSQLSSTHLAHYLESQVKLNALLKSRCRNPVHNRIDKLITETFEQKATTVVVVENQCFDVSVRSLQLQLDQRSRSDIQKPHNSFGALLR